MTSKLVFFSFLFSFSFFFSFSVSLSLVPCSFVCMFLVCSQKFLISDIFSSLFYKASNILLNSEGVIKIADFGVSEQLNNNLNQAKGLVGSPYWMSPETIKFGKTDYRSDIWSLGITAIELAEGYLLLLSSPPLLSSSLL